MFDRLVLTCVLFLGVVPIPAVAADADASLRITWDKNMLRIRSPRIPGGVIETHYLEAFCRTGSTHRKWGKTVIGHKTVKVDAGADGRGNVGFDPLRGV